MLQQLGFLLLLLSLSFWESKYSLLIVTVLRYVHQIIGSFQAPLTGTIMCTQTPTRISLMKSDICFPTHAIPIPLELHDSRFSNRDSELVSSIRMWKFKSICRQHKLTTIFKANNPRVTRGRCTQRSSAWSIGELAWFLDPKSLLSIQATFRHTFRFHLF